MDEFHWSEREHALEPLAAGPLQQFFTALARLQAIERARQEADPEYEPRLRIAFVTTERTGAHARDYHSSRSGIQVDQAFFRVFAALPL